MFPYGLVRYTHCFPKVTETNLCIYRDRSWCAVYTTEEVNYAKTIGYQMLYIYEAYNYSKSGSPFQNYIKTLAYLKIKVSLFVRATVWRGGRERVGWGEEESGQA